MFIRINIKLTIVCCDQAPTITPQSDIIAVVEARQHYTLYNAVSFPQTNNITLTSGGGLDPVLTSYNDPCHALA